MVILDKENLAENKKDYFNMIREFNSVPLGKSAMVINAIASYFARKHLNHFPEAFTELPSQDDIDNAYGLKINRLNSDYIIDQRLVLKKIRDYINYYKLMTYHEFVPDGIVLPRAVNVPAFEGVDVSVKDSYYNLGYSLLLSPDEYLMMIKDSNLYRKLSLVTALGCKFLKSVNP